jgi:hypothetical protein
VIYSGQFEAFIFGNSLANMLYNKTVEIKALIFRESGSENNADGSNEGGGCFVRFFEANFRVAEAKREALECEASALTTELTAPETKLL